MKTLNYDEWLEGCESFIDEAKRFIKRARIVKWAGLNTFGRDFYLVRAERNLELATECLARALNNAPNAPNAFDGDVQF